MMLKLWVRWQCFRARQHGQGMTEYGLILALVAVVIIGTLTFLGGSLEAKFKSVCEALGGCSGAAGGGN